jgi:hypothetical protein
MPSSETNLKPREAHEETIHVQDDPEKLSNFDGKKSLRLTSVTLYFQLKSNVNHRITIFFDLKVI